tara:strand:+ start:379 stop:822 length:444 start_codon:yes stop_codon:yes gene_type:complete
MQGTVNAWASKAGVALAQKKVDFKETCEINVFKELVGILDVKNCIVTMDAAGCHAQTLNTVIAGEGDYCVGLKKNQKAIYRNAEALFGRNECDIDFFETSNKGHGREETRKYFSLNVDKDFQYNLENKWKKRKQEPFLNIKSVTKVI